MSTLLRKLTINQQLSGAFLAENCLYTLEVSALLLVFVNITTLHANSKLGNLLCRICEQAEKLGLLIEHEQLTATLVPTMRKPFDVLAEGLLVQSSRGDKTAIELFIAGIRGWEAGLRRRLENGKSSSSS